MLMLFSIEPRTSPVIILLNTINTCIHHIHFCSILQHTPIHVYSEVTPTCSNRTNFEIRVYRIAASQPSPKHALQQQNPCSIT